MRLYTTKHPRERFNIRWNRRKSAFRLAARGLALYIYPGPLIEWSLVILVTLTAFRLGVIYAYAAELDIKKFYPSLSPREVMRFLRRKIKDEAFLGLIWRIIKDGIKIGFYISQWLANAVLEPLDHYIREKLGDGVRHYVRYIDNLTIFGHNKKKLHRAIRSIMEFLGRMGLRLKENWQLYNTRKRMVNAVGYRYKRGLTLIRKKNLLRLKRQCTRARKRIAAHRKIAPIQARGILSRSGQLKHCAGWSLYDKHVRPIEKTIKSVVREASRKERILCSST